MLPTITKEPVNTPSEKKITRVEEWTVSPEAGGNSMLYITYSDGTKEEVYAVCLSGEQYRDLKVKCEDDSGAWVEMD